MKKIIAIGIISFIIIGFLLYKKEFSSKADTTPGLTKISLALDWTPNTNHTGIYVAREKGWFKDVGLDLEILPYSSSVSPDVLVSTGKADFGIGFTEWIVADAALGAPVKSIAAILAHNTSALMVLESSDIKSPKDLTGKIYGGYGAPLEEAVVGQIIKTAGGNPDIRNITLDMEGLKALASKRIDFIWGYQGWESIQAKKEGYPIRSFPVIDYGIPDYYTPNIIARFNPDEKEKEIIKKFLVALSRGYEFAGKNSTESARLLIQSAPKGTFPDENLVYESQNYLSSKYADEGKKWGYQDSKMWHEFPQFILDSGSIKDKDGKVVKELDLDSLYTNEFLPVE